MEDGQEPIGDVEVVDSTEGNSPEVQGTETTQSNPFWGQVEEKLSPELYGLIQPYLHQADAEANKRISELNGALKPWKQFQDQNISPDDLTQAMGIVQHMNANPVEVFNHLQDFLKREGRLPTNQELVDEVDGENEEDPHEAKLRELQEQQEQFKSYLEQQAQEQARQEASREAEAWLDKGIEEVKGKFPHFQKEDMAEVFRIAASQTQNGQEPDLVAVAQSWNNTLERIRTAPRADANAPRVPGGIGGAPSLQQATPTTMTPEERVAFVASRLG